MKHQGVGQLLQVNSLNHVAGSLCSVVDNDTNKCLMDSIYSNPDLVCVATLDRLIHFASEVGVFRLRNT